MFKEKLYNYFNGEGDNKKKIENLIFLLIILIITVIAINFIWKEDSTALNEEEKNSIKLVTSNEKSNEESNKNLLEERLEEILTNINGVRKSKSINYI